MIDEQKEIQKHFRDGQDKYAYYIIALCVAATAYSVNITIGLKLQYTQIPLGLAILSWAISIYFGLKFISGKLDILYTNNVYFEILQGRDKIAGNHPEAIKIGTDTLMNIMNDKGLKVGKRFSYQFRFFIGGFCLFLVWHVLEMYMKTISL